MRPSRVHCVILVTAIVSSTACADNATETGPPAADASSPVNWAKPIEVAAGDAHRGPWRMNESQFHYVDDPTVAIDGEGRMAIAWADQREQDIYFQLYSPDGEPLLAEPANVSRSGDVFSWLPRMALDPDEPEHVYILWQEILFTGGTHGGEILFARSTDGGATFSEPINLSNTPAGAGKGRLTRRSWHNGSLDLAIGGDGTLHATWTEYEGSLHVSRSTDGGRSFSEPVHVAGGDAEPARGPSLAVEDQDTVHLAWTVGEDAAADIRFASSRDGGRTFDEPQPVGAGPGHADAPKLAVANDGTIHLVCSESPRGPLQGYRIQYTRRVPGADAFEPPREIAAPDGDIASVGFPHLALAGDDRVYLAWKQFPDARGRPRGLGFTMSSDGGDTFAAASIVPGTDDEALGFSGSQQGLLMSKLAVNDAGAIAVVNSTFRQGRSSHVWLIRGRVEAVPAGEP